MTRIESPFIRCFPLDIPVTTLVYHNNYIYLVCKGTIDGKVLYALQKKVDLAKMLVDDYRNGGNPLKDCNF